MWHPNIKLFREFKIFNMIISYSVQYLYLSAISWTVICWFYTISLIYSSSTFVVDPNVGHLLMKKHWNATLFCLPSLVARVVVHVLDLNFDNYISVTPGCVISLLMEEDFFFGGGGGMDKTPGLFLFLGISSIMQINN